MNVTLRAVAVLACVLALGGCRSELPYRWQEPTRGLVVHSDYPENVTAYVFEKELLPFMDCLQRVFEVTDLRDLRIYLHNQANYQLRTDVAVNGWHHDGEIHVMAGWKGLEIGFPSVTSESTVLHEFVHALVARSELQLPRWFEEGLCEVLSASSLLDGELLWLPNGGRERNVRTLLARDELLSAEELFACVDHYPDSARGMRGLYAQGTSFVWWLFAKHAPVDGRAIEAVAKRDDLGAEFAAWREALPNTPVSRLLLPYLRDERAAVREVALDAISSLGEDEELWAVAGALLHDESRSVRGSIRIDAICTPDSHELAQRHYREWAASEERNLRMAGQLALALLGDRQMAVTFCRSLVAGDREWTQPMMWLVHAMPKHGDHYRRLCTVDCDVAQVAAEVADWIEARGDELAFGKGAYRLR